MMHRFSIADRVSTTRVIRSGRTENGPIICQKDMKGTVIKVEHNEWDGVHVKLESGSVWWFKPNQLARISES